MKKTALLVVLLAVACAKDSPPASPAPAPVPAPATPAGPLAEGTVAPDFEVVAHDGKTYKLSALAGSPVVLYFFPKADTPG